MATNLRPNVPSAIGTAATIPIAATAFAPEMIGDQQMVHLSVIRRTHTL